MTIKEKAELIVKDIKKEQETNPIHIFNVNLIAIVSQLHTESCQ